MEKIICSKCIKVNEEGYLTDFSQWDKFVAAEIAKEECIADLTEKHWKVIDYLQDQHKNNAALSIRKIGKSGVITIEEFYALFPQGPLKKATKIAGIPKPASCI